MCVCVNRQADFKMSVEVQISRIAKIVLKVKVCRSILWGTYYKATENQTV